MKKLFYLLAFALPLCFAQVATAADDASLNGRATKLTRQLAEKVPLNEAQFVKVRRLNLDMLSATQSLKEKFAADPAQLDIALAELQDRYEWDMASILWPRQMVAYRQSKANMTAMDNSSSSR
ncbi:hypothetical protein [Solirubrum puertoriconensis]|uniref:Uncharacterized protein n=1 Tax=Solirubrum puertoriconensis TaxID=1751427 RepID=A0A9X0HL02_SOLP1|nr:hypothetical protein [Solirubrum puertoriconensis]KUG07716.1 hypothetical protein ASU33_15475 [Solirubrum puertoriconensis]